MISGTSSRLTYCATSFSRLWFDFHPPHVPLFEVAARTHLSAEFSRAVKEFARTPETGWTAVGAPRGGAGTTARVLHITPQALVVYPSIAVLANALGATLNEPRLLAPAACWVAL